MNNICNQEYSVKIQNTPKSCRNMVLEIGAGLGEHIKFENLENQQYSVLELRDNMAKVIKEKFPNVETYVGDIQKKTEFEDKTFDRILAIHVLEHLPDLPSALQEIYRILKDDGQFTIVIPCEGSLAYKIARGISAKKIFERRYKMKYDWFIKTEHINLPSEIVEELIRYFSIKNRSFFPLIVPLMFCNLCIGMDLQKDKKKWPKEMPQLTNDQIEIKNDFMRYWHEVLPKKYSIVEQFNHKYPVRMSEQLSSRGGGGGGY